MSGQTDKHLPIVSGGLYEELQEDGAQLSELWPQGSIKLRAGKIGERCEPFVTPGESARIYSKTRIAGEKRPRRSHGRDYFPRCIAHATDVAETYFFQLQGRSRGLTVVVEFSTGPPLWMGVLIISQMPISLLSVRADAIETQENHRMAPLPETVESLSLRYMGVARRPLFKKYGSKKRRVCGFCNSRIE